MLAAFVAVAIALAPQDPAGTWVVRGAVVHSGAASAWQGDLAVRRGKFVAAPAAPERVLLCPGAFITPGIIDSHGHLLGLGSSLVEVNLVGSSSYEEVVRKTAAAAERLPKGTWVIGRGWDQNDWPTTTLPEHHALSQAVPEHPVWLTRIDGHAGLANARALQLAGITRTTVAAAGGEILRDAQGEATGVLVDHAMSLVPEPSLSDEQIVARLLAAQQECLRLGLTCVHDAGVPSAVLEAMVGLHRAGKWQLRTYVMLPANERLRIAQGPWQADDARIVVRAVKAYADGALGSRGAVLLEPYHDRAGWKGLFLTPKAGLAELAQLCADHNMQLCTHAIGDAAVRAVLDAYAQVQLNGPLAARRFRVEHAQIVAPTDFARFATLGVLPSMQPTHLTSDMPWAGARLGPQRTLTAYAWRTFLNRNVPLPFGSDFPVESADPRCGFFAAVTTKATPDGPALRKDQCLTRAEMLAGFTRHAAYAMFSEPHLGSIELGKVADFTVWDRNLLTCPEAELLQAKVLLTVVDGAVVYDGR